MSMRFTKHAFTSILLLLLVGCSSMTIPFVDREADQSREVTVDEDGFTVFAEPAQNRQKKQNTDGANATDIEVEESLDADAVAEFIDPATLVTREPTPKLRSGSQALFDRGVTLLKEGKLEAASALFEEVTAEQPELSGPWVNLGHIYRAQGDTAKALEAYEQAATANPKNCDALNPLGVMARAAGDFQVAEKYYQRCIAAQPNFSAARLNLAILYDLYMGRFGEALAAYNDYQAMLASPDDRVNGWMLDLERRTAALARR